MEVSEAEQRPSSFPSIEDRLKFIKDAKNEISRTHLMDRLKDLQGEVDKAPRVEELEDYKVTQLLVESQQWEEQLSSISNEFIELKIDTVEYPMTEDKADELENLFQEVSSAVKDAKSGLEREDKVREL